MITDPGLYDPNQEDTSTKWYATKVFFIELTKIVALTLIVIFAVRHFLFKPFVVKGASMEPNFFEREYLIIDELSYRFVEPKRGEVIVFRQEDDRREFFLKRVIGLPGEKIKVQGGKVVVYNIDNPQGIVVMENGYLPDSSYTSGEMVLTLSEDEYYVLGDNRNVSLDSRKFGSVNRKMIVGRAWLRGFPFDRFGITDLPEYNL